MTRKKVSWIVIGLILVAAVGGAIYWLFATGRLVYVSNGSNAAGANKTVCDAAIVKEYNATAGVDEEDVYRVDAEQRKSITDKIKSTQGFEGDPTCRAILYSYAIFKEDKSAAREQYDALVTLHKESKYANPELNETASLRYYQIQVDSLGGYDAGNTGS